MRARISSSVPDRSTSIVLIGWMDLASIFQLCISLVFVIDFKTNHIRFNLDKYCFSFPAQSSDFFPCFFFRIRDWTSGDISN